MVSWRPRGGGRFQGSGVLETTTQWEVPGLRCPGDHEVPGIPLHRKISWGQRRVGRSRNLLATVAFCIMTRFKRRFILGRALHFSDHSNSGFYCFSTTATPGPCLVRVLVPRGLAGPKTLASYLGPGRPGSQGDPQLPVTFNFVGLLIPTGGITDPHRRAIPGTQIYPRDTDVQIYPQGQPFDDSPGLREHPGALTQSVSRTLPSMCPGQFPSSGALSRSASLPALVGFLRHANSFPIRTFF